MFSRIYIITIQKTTCILKEYAQGTNEIVSGRFLNLLISRLNILLLSTKPEIYLRLRIRRSTQASKVRRAGNPSSYPYHSFIHSCFLCIISPLESAQHELSEEARLAGGEWISLLPEDQKDGISELKWGRNRFVPYLCINPHQDDQPRERDAEECIQVVDNVAIKDLKTFITKGEMMLPSVQTSWMALEYLSNLGML